MTETEKNQAFVVFCCFGGYWEGFLLFWCLLNIKWVPGHSRILGRHSVANARLFLFVMFWPVWLWVGQVPGHFGDKTLSYFVSDRATLQVMFIMKLQGPPGCCWLLFCWGVHQMKNIVRTDDHGRSTQAPMSLRSHRDWQRHQQVGACVDCTWASVLTFIPWPYLIVLVKSLMIWPEDSPWNPLLRL